MKKLTLLAILSGAVLTTASANFSFMGDMIKDMRDTARDMKTNTIDVAKDIKDEGIDAVKDMKDESIDGIKDIKDDVNSTDINSTSDKSKDIKEEAKK